ncbi:hypothetical protein [Mesorhizobium sp. WSM3626]|uniref:hypothetical protein n=1 Tax=Mesorhizobium sp. WSM3626 TaxID=1040987 RepID=UPI0004875570|nr:hypothetical protein [Mesorhizobium sp. WSM3626]
MIDLSSVLWIVARKGAKSMPRISCRLAEDDAGRWQMVFDPHELQLYIEFIHCDPSSKPGEWISVEDFLAWAPRNPLHRKALDCFVAFLAKAMLTQMLIS